MIFIDRYGESAVAVFGASVGGGCAERLEREVSRLTGRSAVAVCSVDAALHTALHLCGAARGDYVFVPSFTFYSYIATVENAGCVPVFLDCDPITRCVSAAALDTALLWSELQDKPPKAAVIDSAFGSAPDGNVLLPLCKAHDVATVWISDGFGGAGNGDVCVVGFDKRVYGGGAVLLCDDVHTAKQFTRAEYSDGENHDYRINNTVAAIDIAGLAASERVAKRARKNLDALCATHENIAKPTDGDSGRYALCKAPCGVNALRRAGFTVKRPPCAHTLPRYEGCVYFEHEPGYSVCESYADRCLIDMDIGILDRLKLSRMIKE